MLFTKKRCINRVQLGLRCLFSHYETLGVEMDASQQQIKNSFYKLAKKYHPDLAKETSNAQKFIKIQEAYEILGDEQKRKEYDRTFHAHPNTNPYGAYGHPYRNPHEQTHQYYTNHYQNFAYDARPSIFTLIKENIFTIACWCAYAYIFWEIIIFLEQKMNEADIERQNVAMMAKPGMIDRRMKIYAKQIKQKNVYGQLIDLKFRTAAVKSTKSLQQQKQSIKSINGIQKQGKEPRKVALISEQYM